MESGNLVDTAGKLQITASLLALMKYDACGVGASDAMHGEQFYKALAASKIAVVDPLAPDKGAVPSMVKNVNGCRVGIVAFTGTNSNDQTATVERRRAFYAAYNKARATSDVLILLDQANLATTDWLQRTAPRLGAPDIVIGGLPSIGLAAEQIVGKTHVMPTSMQGKAVGVVDVEWAKGQQPKVSARKVMLEEGIVEDDAISKQVKEFLGTTSKAHATTAVAADPSTTMSPHTCKTCHSSQFQDWAQSKHAAAMKTLVDANRTVPECLTCHSEPYRKAHKVVIPADGLGGVECITCHSAALPHGFERRNAQNKTKVDPKLCMTCHDKANSPNYDEKTYFPKIVHKKATQTPAPPGG